MSNEGTKEQIKTFLQRAVENARNPNSREQILRKRKEKAKKIEKMYGI